jgi:hypothetical protein
MEIKFALTSLTFVNQRFSHVAAPSQILSSQRQPSLLQAVCAYLEEKHLLRHHGSHRPLA